ncbi:hypothetical protein GCM10008959_20830 [Deinococcus seoulensis]|uniref:Tetratricopeptide repeat protein n=1 Tax=Deinococcus seoulensis TaxID=1837379 RepID=A0ABQ2RUW8_9DEIO|nr:hypothetical protein [Deinococcus seoulensis]GGR58881.1 hypothetical protein GCM10008959_20830 [Deinococcus seoulensis]
MTTDTNSPSPGHGHAEPPVDLHLTASLRKDGCEIHWNGLPLPLSEKWVVFYALLAIHEDRHVTTDEVCGYHPWNRLSPDVAGRDLWRFTRTQEVRHFGQRITSSPARQGSRAFTVSGARVSFQPDRRSVADYLGGLTARDSDLLPDLAECTLLLQGGLVGLALARLDALRDRARNVNDAAHLETVRAMCLDEQGGFRATAAHMPVLTGLLGQPGLTRLNRARILTRAGRHHMLAGETAAAQEIFTFLRGLLSPEDGPEYCLYHLNYGLFLRRCGELDRALHHQKLAHEVALRMQWWHGVYSARSNMVIIHLSLAEVGPARVRTRNLERALDWALRTHSTVTMTRQPLAMAETALLVARAYRLLGQPFWARHWLSRAMDTANHPDPDGHLACCWDEQALLEDADGHVVHAELARRKARRWRGETD